MAITDIASTLRRAHEERWRELARDVAGAALLRGEFVLSSGMRSSYYFDKYLFETKPSILRRLAGFIGELIPANTDRIAGPELGAVALATATSLETGLPFVIVKKDAKDYATGRLVEGELFPNDNVVVVEDVITTATQAIRAARQLERAQARVTLIVGVIDREQGGPENINAAGYEFRALFKNSDLQVTRTRS
jgi:orotate phosphoribosyltransferase